MNVYPLKHYSIQQVHDSLDDHVKKIQAAAIDMTDNLVVQAITQAAKEEGVTDLYLIDKKFAADAIKEKLERDDPKPLTIEDLRKLDEEPVWVKPEGVKAGYGMWCVVNYNRLTRRVEAFIPGIENTWFEGEEYGKTWTAYRHKPKEE